MSVFVQHPSLWSLYFQTLWSSLLHTSGLARYKKQERFLILLWDIRQFKYMFHYLFFPKITCSFEPFITHLNRHLKVINDAGFKRWLVVETIIIKLHRKRNIYLESRIIIFQRPLSLNIYYSWSQTHEKENPFWRNLSEGEDFKRNYLWKYS